MTLRIGGFATLIQVFDMPTSLAFYRDVLEFEVISEVPDDGQLSASASGRARALAGSAPPAGAARGRRPGRVRRTPMDIASTRAW